MQGFTRDRKERSSLSIEEPSDPTTHTRAIVVRLRIRGDGRRGAVAAARVIGGNQRGRKDWREFGMELEGNGIAVIERRVWGECV
jgi:hypothetical protein